MPESDLLPYARYGKIIVTANLRQASDQNVVDKVRKDSERCKTPLVIYYKRTFLKKPQTLTFPVFTVKAPQTGPRVHQRDSSGALLPDRPAWFLVDYRHVQ